MEFYGYPRPDGRVGVRNHVLILPTCNCASGVCERVYRMVEGTTSFVNQNGCSQTQEDVQYTIDVLCGFADNPNVYAVVLVGVGCEVCSVNRIGSEIRRRTDKPMATVVIQEDGGSLGAIHKAAEYARAFVEQASRIRPVPCPASRLILATECGGSDATSGIAANPALGAACDCLVEAGGTVILSETTEFMGAEHILARRAATPEVAARILEIVSRYEEYLKKLDTDLRGTNPAPGNRQGGISTLEEKSLGCIYKGGSGTIMQVYEYAQAVTETGLVIMDTPGADSASLCGMAAGGAQIAVFTTGRGTPIGNPIMPVIKVTGNPETYGKMTCDMDFDASGVITRGESADALGQELLEQILRTAGGEKTKSEILKMNEIGISRLCNYV